LKERLFLKRVNILRTLEDGTFKDELLNTVRLQIVEINKDEYHVKKHKFEIEELQNNDLNYITDELYEKIKLVSQYIEDKNNYKIQSFQMLILNAQESIVDNKENNKFADDIKNRCFVLKSKVQTINAVKEKEMIIDNVLQDRYNLLEDIEELEIVRQELENISDLSKENKKDPIKTNFDDKIEEVRDVDNSTFVNVNSLKTQIQKVLEEYIDNLYVIKQLKDTKLITNTDIQNIKQYILNLDKIVEDKLNENEEFKDVIKSIIQTSNKQVANNILDNIVSKENYTQKQIELMNKIKNLIFGSTFMNIHSSVVNVKDMLGSELYPISSDFENLSEFEQDDIIEVIDLIEELEVKEYE